MKKEDVLFDLKVMLYNEVKLHIEECQKLDKEKLRLDFLNDLLSYLNSTDIYDWYEARFFVDTLLEETFDPITSKILFEKFGAILYTNINNQRKIVGEEEIYEPQMEEFYNTILDEYETQKAKYEILRRKNEANIQNVLNYKTIHKCFKNGVTLNRYYREVISNYMKENGFSSEKQVLVNEAIRSHNLKYARGLSDYPKSSIERMLNTKLRKFDIDEALDEELSPKFETTIQGLLSQIDMASEEEVQTILDDIKGMSDSFTKEEMDYVYINVLNGLLDIIYDAIDQVKDINNYDDDTLKTISMDTYFETLNKYYTVFKHLKNITKEKGEEFTLNEVNESEEIEDTSKGYTNTVVYLTNGDQAFIERDIKGFPNEYYSKIKSLIEGKKQGMLTSRKDTILKGTNDKIQGFGKLKDDQVRIVYKPLGNSVYLIIGAFDKRETGELVGYKAMAKRYSNYRIPPVDELISASPEIENRFFNSLDEGSRKSSR